MTNEIQDYRMAPPPQIEGSDREYLYRELRKLQTVISQMTRVIRELQDEASSN